MLCKMIFTNMVRIKCDFNPFHSLRCFYLLKAGNVCFRYPYVWLSCSSASDLVGVKTARKREVELLRILLNPGACDVSCRITWNPEIHAFLYKLDF